MPEWQVKQLDGCGDSWYAHRKKSIDAPEANTFTQEAVRGAKPVDLIYWLLTHEFVESLRSSIILVRQEEPEIGASLSLQLD